MDHYRKIDSGHPIEKAKEADAREIAELICGDPEIGGHYEAENLAAQLADRIRTGTGRSYIIRESGNIAAHSAAMQKREILQLSEARLYRRIIEIQIIICY